MTPDDFDDDRRALLRLHRAATGALDERPAARVRAAVLAQAAEAGAPPAPRRWPRALAAGLVVSVMAGLVVTRTLRDEPERIAAGSDRPAPAAEQRVAAARADPAAAEPVAAGSATPVAPPAPRRRTETTPPAEPRGSKVAREARHDAARAADDPPSIASARSSAPVTAESLARLAADAQRDAASGAMPLDDRSSSRLLALRMERTPDAWVAHIVELRRSGRDDEADRELDALHARYPQFVVPLAASRVEAPR